MPLAWKDRIKVASATTGTGTLTLGSAASGYRTFAAGDDGKIFAYVIEDGTAWETGVGTYTHSGTTFARTAVIDSSTGSAINCSGSELLFVDLIAEHALTANLAAQAITPGGRLTLTTNVPVTTSDVTAATNVYYTPHVHNIINLWDGNVWKAAAFSQVTQALGTLTSGLPYDVFGYLSSGALATELLAWTNGTTRATAITLQDGRYCKSGVKTRLYLGTIYTTSTTETEDSAAKRFVYNMYNQVERPMLVTELTDSWTYATDSWRSLNNSNSNRVQVVIGSPVALVNITALVIANGANAGLGIGEDSATAVATEAIGNYVTNSGGNASIIMPGQSLLRKVPAIGYHYYQALERAFSATTITYYGDGALSDIKAGLGGWVTQ